MLVMALAVAVTVYPAATRVPKMAPTLTSPCMVAPARCMTVEQREDAAYRIGGESERGPDVKMDAYRVDVRPCRQSAFRCPKRGKEVFRLGEPVEQTLMRSFGLD